MIDNMLLSREVMKLTKKILALLLLSSVTGHVAAQWSLEGAVKKSGKENSLVLDMTLSYQGTAAIETYASSLPWGIRDRLVLVAIPLTGYSPALEPALYIDDPRIDPITIRPGEVLHGQINLIERFPALANYNRKAPLVICYRFLFRAIDFENKGFSDGCRIVYDQK